MKECLCKGSFPVMSLTCSSFNYTNVNKLHVNLLHESSTLHVKSLTFNNLTMFTTTNRDVPLRFVSNAIVKFYAERNFYRTTK